MNCSNHTWSLGIWFQITSRNVKGSCINLGITCIGWSCIGFPASNTIDCRPGVFAKGAKGHMIWSAMDRLDLLMHLHSFFFVYGNGSLIGFLISPWGLRQGDPLSPNLFALCMKLFSLLIDRAYEGGFLSSFSLRGRGEIFNFSHLLFAGNKLVFCKDSEDQLFHMNWILLCFESFSGLRVN